MFGYVVADLSALTEDQKRRYRGCYCGLCRALGRRHGALSRLTLNYDMTFLVMLLTSMYEPEETNAKNRCLVHPLRPREWWRSRFTDYAADMTVALAYHNALDDWTDDRSLVSLAEARCLRRRYRAVQREHPEQCAAIERCLAELSALEKANSPDADAAAASFGALMGALFSPEPDAVWQPHFRRFGDALGRFVYMMDAVMDAERDEKRGSYNPLLRLDPPLDEASQLAMLKMLIADAAAEFELLPVVQDAEILRSVLYSGVWTRYLAREAKKKQREGSHKNES